MPIDLVYWCATVFSIAFFVGIGFKMFINIVVGAISPHSISMFYMGMPHPGPGYAWTRLYVNV